MTNDPFPIISSIAGGAILTAVTGGLFYLPSWGEVGLLFISFSAMVYFTIRSAMGR